jgi:hypothetical protein
MFLKIMKGLNLDGISRQYKVDTNQQLQIEGHIYVVLR